MSVIFKYQNYETAPELNKDQDDSFRWNQTFEPIELPLVITTPGGIKGLHYSPGTVERTKFLDDLDKELFVDEYTYHHKYERNNDILLFDNCITLHNRQGSPIERVAYREPCDYAQLIPDGYNYYSQEPYKTQFEEMRKDIQETLGVKSIAEQNMVFKKYIQPKFPKREWKNNDLVR